MSCSWRLHLFDVGILCVLPIFLKSALKETPPSEGRCLQHLQMQMHYPMVMQAHGQVLTCPGHLQNGILEDVHGLFSPSFRSCSQQCLQQGTKGSHQCSMKPKQTALIQPYYKCKAYVVQVTSLITASTLFASFNITKSICSCL